MDAAQLNPGGHVWQLPGMTLNRQVSTGAEWAGGYSSSHLLTLHLRHGGLTQVEQDHRFQEHWIPEGSLCLMPAGPVGASRWSTLRELIFVAIDAASAAETLADTPAARGALQRRIGAFDPQARSLVLTLAEEAAAGSPSGELFAETLTRALLLRLHAAHGDPPPARPAAHRAGLSGASLRRVLDRLHGDLARSPSIRELAALARLSPDHFARAFRRSVGLPPHRYLLQLRVDAAKQRLLSSEQDLALLAIELGFTDQSHFQNVFRRFTGSTPLRFRRRQAT